VWSDASGQAWAVGGMDSALILHYDGKAWSIEDNLGDEPLVAIRGSDPGTLRAVGRGGAILAHRPPASEGCPAAAAR
jgi:hypothetical protein